MSLMFLTDLHLDNYKPFSHILANGMNSRLRDQLQVVQDITNLIEKEKPEAIIFLGDLFNGISDSLPKIIYNAGFFTILEWSKNTPFFLLVGNHDIYRGMHVLSTFETLKNVQVISKTTKVKLDGYDIDLIPWDNQIPEVKGDICAGHLEVYGAMLNVVYSAKFGYYPATFFGYEHVLLGHFHNHQEFKVEGAKKAGYIGAIMQTDRRTSPHQQLGLTILEDGEWRHVPIESPKIYDRTIENVKDFESFADSEYIADDYFKLTIRDSKVSIPKDWINVIAEYDLPVTYSSRLGLDESSTQPISDAVDKWIEASKTPLDKEELKTTAEELLK